MRELATERDRGMTLIELIVTVVVAGLILALIGVTFANGLVAQRDGVARDAATGAANLVSVSLSTSVRNSTDVRVSADGDRLDARYIAPNGQPECRAWALVPAAHGNYSLVYRSDRAGAVPSVDASWPVLVDDVVGGFGASKAFSAEGDRGVRTELAVTVDNATVAISDGVAAQAVSGEVLSCWP